MTLSPEDQQRIAAEEAYRAQLRAQEASRKRYGCAAWAFGVPALFVIAVLTFAAVGRMTGGSSSAGTSRADFVVNCQEQVKARLKAPATARISNAFSDGILEGSTGYTWNGTVDAENGFGANIRTGFRCEGPASSPSVTMN